jgi:hypothetical protein
VDRQDYDTGKKNIIHSKGKAARAKVRSFFTAVKQYTLLLLQMETMESKCQQASLLMPQAEGYPAPPPYSLQQGHGAEAAHQVNPESTHTGPTQVQFVVSSLPTKNPHVCCWGVPAHQGAIAVGIFELFFELIKIVLFTRRISADSDLSTGNESIRILVTSLVAIFSIIEAMIIICICLMFWGIYSKSPGLVLPNVIFHYVQCVLVGLYTVGAIGVIVRYGMAAIYLVMIAAINLGLTIWFTKIVIDCRWYLLYELNRQTWAALTCPINNVS